MAAEAAKIYPTVNHIPGGGDIKKLLLKTNMDTGCLRPFEGDDERTYVTICADTPQEQTLCVNAPSTLRRDEYIRFDEAVQRVTRPRLRVIGDLTGQGLTYTIPNGMAYTVLQYQTQTDAGQAMISMDGIRRDERDRPAFDLANLPLPIISSGFSFSLRDLMVSRNRGAGLDTTMAEQCGRRVAETAEDLVLGTAGTFTYGGGTVYGLTNHPGRQTYVLTNPTGAWTPDVLITELLDMFELLRNDNFFGPYGVIFSTAWARYLDEDYSAAYPRTLRTRLQELPDITSIRTVDRLTGFQIIVYAQTTDVIRIVNGMGMTTVQWETEGGMEQHFKIMTIIVPQVRPVDPNGNSGIVHGTAP